MEVGATNWIAIVDRNGIVLVAPGRDPSSYLRDVSQHEGVRQALQGKRGTGFIWQDGKHVLVSRHPLPSLGWAVLVEIPLEAINQELWRYERPLGVLGLLFDALALVIGSVIALLYRRLKQGREHIQQILNASQDAFISTDERGMITAWNPQAEVYFGYSAPEALGRPAYEMIVPPRYREAQLRGVRQLLKVGSNVGSNKRLELTALHRSGREFPVELSISHVRGPSKNSLSAFIRDISQRRESFRQSEERFEKAFRSSPLAITISTEKDGHYVDANDAFLKLVGYRR
jgi:PAS domain S-box-containing protein